MSTEKSRKYPILFAVLFAVSVCHIGFSGSAVAGDKYEKCYGIAKKGENDGWGRNLNPGKYEAERDFDGNAWKFTRKGRCLEEGGQLEPFAGVGNPKSKDS